MKRLLVIGCWLLAGGAWAQVNSADNDGSLFPKDYKNPLIDRTARNVGDLLTVVVSEQASSNMAASTTATKKDTNSTTAPFITNPGSVPILGHLLSGLGAGLTNLGTNANSSVAGAGTSTNTSQLTAKVAVIVKQILPNGNMLVEGTRWVKVNKEETNITFTGIVRRDDVRADNTIASENVAEAKITNVSKGLVADRQRKGFITRLLDWLF
ncbi:MAG: flagellar basal body L-ring protein FlgH [Fimbriimonadales bacterium]